jgi:hypothetical protein
MDGSALKIGNMRQNHNSIDELKKQQRQMKKILQHTGDKQRISSKELAFQISILVYR